MSLIIKSPSVILNNPKIISTKVVLPVPEGPLIPILSFLFISKLEFFIIFFSFKLYLKEKFLSFKFLKLKSLKDEIVDSVGAGDIFHSFASVLSTSIKDNNHLSLLLAQIAGSIAVTIEGNERTPTLNEIKNTLNFYLNK